MDFLDLEEISLLFSHFDEKKLKDCIKENNYILDSDFLQSFPCAFDITVKLFKNYSSNFKKIKPLCCQAGV